MLWVVLLIVLAIVFGGLGLLVDALQFLLVVGIVLAVIAIGVGFWLRGKVRDALGRPQPGRDNR